MGYGITLRTWGEYACFTRPEMKIERVSYDVITPAAARGLIEAVYWKPAIRWVIDEIHVINPIEFTNIRRNEVSSVIPEQNARRIQRGTDEIMFISAVADRQQKAAMVLRNVEYIIKAHFEIVPEAAGPEDTIEKHYNIVLRRLRKGQHFHKPCFGTREFPAEVELIDDGQILPISRLKGEQDLGWMFFDYDYAANKQLILFRALMRDGVILPQAARKAR